MENRPHESRQALTVLLATVAIQLCLGMTYIWSVFQTGIANTIFQGDNAAANLPFSLQIAMLTVGGMLGGKLVTKIPIKYVIKLGGAIISLSFLISSFVTTEWAWGLWATYGLMAGVGMGMTYSTTISCVQQWYPTKKGFVTGVIVSALGFGGVIFAPIAEKLMHLNGGQGVGELPTFRMLSVVFLVITFFGSEFLKAAPQQMANIQQNSTEKPLRSLTPGEVLHTPHFYILVLLFALSCMGGLMMIGFAKPIAVAKGLAETATVGVLLISIFNSLGRLFWGGVSDKIGRVSTLLILFTGSALLPLFVNLAEGYMIFILIGCIGFIYGGLLSTFPAMTADLFGPKHMALIYGMVMFGFGLGGMLASFIGGYYKNLAKEDIQLMYPAFIIAAVFAAMSNILLLVMKRLKLNRA